MRFVVAVAAVVVVAAEHELFFRMRLLVFSNLKITQETYLEMYFSLPVYAATPLNVVGFKLSLFKRPFIYIKDIASIKLKFKI